MLYRQTCGCTWTLLLFTIDVKQMDMLMHSDFVNYFIVCYGCLNRWTCCCTWTSLILLLLSLSIVKFLVWTQAHWYEMENSSCDSNDGRRFIPGVTGVLKWNYTYVYLPCSDKCVNKLKNLLLAHEHCISINVDALTK